MKEREKARATLKRQHSFLQDMDSRYNPYEYESRSNRSGKWLKVILIGSIIILLIAAAIFIIDFLSNSVRQKSGGIQGGLGGASSSEYNCTADIYNCSNFTSQTQAQSVYNYCKLQGAGDVNHLDADSNGIACEGL